MLASIPSQQVESELTRFGNHSRDSVSSHPALVGISVPPSMGRRWCAGHAQWWMPASAAVPVEALLAGCGTDHCNRTITFRMAKWCVP